MAESCDITSITSQSSFLALPSENEKVASAECRLDFTTTDCGNLDQDQASTGWEAHGVWHKVG